jgi:hypothetical protein
LWCGANVNGKKKVMEKQKRSKERGLKEKWFLFVGGVGNSVGEEAFTLLEIWWCMVIDKEEREGKRERPALLKKQACIYIQGI